MPSEEVADELVTGNFHDFVEMPLGQQKNEEMTWGGFWECHDPEAKSKGVWEWGAVWHIAI